MRYYIYSKKIKLHNPFPPFFFNCSALTLASANCCFFSNFDALHFAKLSAVTGVPFLPSAANLALCSSMISSIVFSRNTSVTICSSGK